MPDKDIEIAEAKRLLADKPAGTKISRAKPDRYDAKGNFKPAEPSYLNSSDGKHIEELDIQFEHSFIIDEQQNISLISREKIGAGTFGSVKKALPIQPSNVDQLIKVQNLSKRGSSYENTYLKFAKEEGKTNEAAGIANNKGFHRTNKEGTKKYYQSVDNLGNTLAKKIDPYWILDDCLTVSIDLLLKVNAVHTGEAFKDKKPRAHRDIKPQNITVDNSGQINLIDYGAATTDLMNTDPRGTPSYWAMDIDPIYGVDMAKIDTVEDYNGVIRDKIATLRTIFHPSMHSLSIDGERFSIFPKFYFNKLPPCMQELFDTTKVARHTKENSPETMQFFAAVLQYYKDNKHILPEDIERIRANPREQLDILSKVAKKRIVDLLVEVDSTKDLRKINRLHKEIDNFASKYKHDENMVVWANSKKEVLAKLETRIMLAAMPNVQVSELTIKIMSLLENYKSHDKNKEEHRDYLLSILRGSNPTTEKERLNLVLAEVSIDQTLSTYKNPIKDPENLGTRLLHSCYEHFSHSTGAKVVNNITHAYKDAVHKVREADENIEKQEITKYTR